MRLSPLLANTTATTTPTFRGLGRSARRPTTTTSSYTSLPDIINAPANLRIRNLPHILPRPLSTRAAPSPSKRRPNYTVSATPPPDSVPGSRSLTTTTVDATMAQGDAPTANIKHTAHHHLNPSHAHPAPYVLLSHSIASTECIPLLVTLMLKSLLIAPIMTPPTQSRPANT